MEMRYGREVIVGTMVIIALLVFVFGTMWLSGQSFSDEGQVRVQFADVSGLKRASPVRVSGVTVGKVEQIEFRDVGNVLVSISVGDKVVPRTDAKATIVGISLVGDYAVDVVPGSGAPLPQGAVIMGTREVGLSEQAAGMTGRLDTILTGVQAMVSPEMTRRLEQTMENLQGTLAAAQQTMALYGNANRGPTAELTRTMTQFRQLGATLDSTLANPALQSALSRSDSLVTNLSAMSQAFAATGNRLDSLLASVEAGEGTLGKLATDSTFYWNMTRAMASFDSLLAEIKRNPGKIPIQVRIF
ncbi:MAG TPA: MlaD family protein [Gemmatimonadales bacterium]|nr:MlaD family protein [Gemmatimonadales bacterium]